MCGVTSPLVGTLAPELVCDSPDFRDRGKTVKHSGSACWEGKERGEVSARFPIAIRKVKRITACCCFASLLVGRHSAAKIQQSSVRQCQFWVPLQKRHFLAVTRSNQCSGEIGSVEEKVDTPSESAPCVTNPVNDVNATYHRLHITTPPREFTDIYQK